MNYEILPITEDHIKSYCDALDKVAKEGKYLGFLEACKSRIVNYTALGK